MIRLGGLWKHEKDSMVYFSGSVGSGRFLVMPNKMKMSEKDPDYVLYIAEKETKGDTK